MKIVRAENIQVQKEENINKKEEKNVLQDVVIDEKKEQTLEELMEETINENKIKVEITLTKKQYELWKKKGEEKWLKQILTNRILKKGKKR